MVGIHSTTKMAFTLGIFVSVVCLFPLQCKAEQDSSNSSEIRESEAIEVVNHFHLVLIDIMKNGPALGFTGRFNQLKPVILKTFNLSRMAVLSIGPRWYSFTDDQKDIFFDRFTRYSIASYAYHFRRFNGERFELIGTRSLPLHERLFVNTKIITPDQPMPIQLNYLMYYSGTQWQILDIYLAGMISELATRRSQFSSILSKQGFDSLITVFDEKIHELSQDS